ncbi:nucleotide sugar dehydrogenase [Candidatus Magnetaquicoccus inordinatus]|uniref:nucleotide sugar dehydrogenase n=1 Tax=Candidatus Magnetaquicoccus inordinatus TaxID=2496818 RepID=UPI00102CC12D|nr:nucleotide sugar dehydrogenase [Candidatus Magnetaquicoccus inordinatus]
MQQNGILPLPLADVRLGIIGLGYVGLPLAVAFGKILPTIGYDTNTQRVEELCTGVDRTCSVSSEELLAAEQLQLSSVEESLPICNIFIVTVPTPVDAHKRPDLDPLKKATATVARALHPGGIVIFESTVYPGTTEEVCVPILEQVSGMFCNKDFTVGYSPERINAGDMKHRLPDIVKITSGSTQETAEQVDLLYRTIIHAGTHPASSIRVAEAAKIIENIQRDINIALMNELSMLFYRLGIDTHEVLAAAGSKWNFIPFHPGLVGGHCIAVDPYYLAYKAQEVDFFPEIILAGRRINDGMGAYVAQQVIQLMIRKRISLVDARVLVMGVTFKENCPDMRNSQVLHIIRELSECGMQISVYDPLVSGEPGMPQLNLITEPHDGYYQAIVLAVAHQVFLSMGAEKIVGFGVQGAVIYDVKHVLPTHLTHGRL